jgi:hypothetical protein
MVHARGPVPQPIQWRIAPRILGLLAWVGYFLLPSEGGIIDGIPAGRVESIGLLLVIWIAAHRVRIAGAWLAATVAIAACVATLAVPGDRGFHARYYATAAAGGAHERSTEYRGAPFTRVDERLAFVRGERDFPLAFFNDHTRFNYLRPGEPDRRYLEFAAAWTGWWRVDGGARTLYLHAPQASAQISVDGSPVLTARMQSADQTVELTLPEGWHRLHVTFSSPYRAPREFSAGEIRGGTLVPFDRGTVRTERIDGRQSMIARALAIAKPIADLIVLCWLAALAGLLLVRRLGEVWQRRLAAREAAFALFLAAGAVEAMRFAWPWAHRLRIIVAGDDPITYEGYARDILFNGILMNGGAPPGQGEPFYYQAFYPYFLAATHAIFGEGFFGALLVQRLLVVVTAVMLARIAIKLRGESVWPVALVVSALFVWWKFAPIAADLLNESLYIPLLTAWAAALIDTCQRPGAGRGAIAGVLGGLAAITRSTSLLSWVLVWPACAWALRRVRGRAAIVGLLIACSLSVFSLIAMRNWIVSRQFAPTSTELGITLRGGNEPPPGLVLDPAPRKAFYDRFGIGGYTAEVIEYAIAAPGPFAANLGRKALFALGFYEPYAEGWGYSPVFIAVWMGALIGVGTLRRRNAAPWLPLLLPLMIAITQYAAVVLVYPKGERLILPVHTLLIPYAAIAAYELLARFPARAR